MDDGYPDEYFSKPSGDGTWYVQRKHRESKIIDKIDKATADRIAWAMDHAHWDCYVELTKDAASKGGA